MIIMALFRRHLSSRSLFRASMPILIVHVVQFCVFCTVLAQTPEYSDHDRLTYSARNSTLTIACVGDSLTFGSGSSGPIFRNAYPAKLQRTPGFEDYNVHNYGQGGMCALKLAGKFSYWTTPTFLMALNSEPNIVILMFGTNDAKKYRWNEIEFKKDYISMIRKFRQLPSNPTIFISIPPPLYSTVGIYGMNATVINEELPRIIPEIASECNVKVIDNFNALGGSALNFTEAYIINKRKPAETKPNDMCHLSDLGYSTIAHNVALTLLADRIS
jgi:acyl-CoA thioesterase I